MESLSLLTFLDDFRAEAVEYVRVLDAQLLAMEREPSDLQAVRTMFLSAHSIKGGAAMLGLDDIRVLAHAMEDVLDELRGERRRLDRETADLLFQAVDQLRELVERSEPGGSEPDESVLRLVDRLRRPAVAVVPEPPAATGLVTSNADRPHILIVEDSATVRSLTVAQLSAGGFDVDTAGDSEQALTKVASGKYELVIAAMETRGLRGPDLAVAIRKMPLGRDTPIILTTSDGNQANHQRALELGVESILRRGSFREHHLVDAARAVLLERAGPEQFTRSSPS